MYLRDQDESGIQLQATHDDGKARLLAVQPANLRAGSTQTLTLVGTNLGGTPDLGTGITIDEVVSGSADRQVLKVTAAADAAPGARAAHLGATTLEQAFTVYDRIDRIEVTPAYAVGRVGGNGGFTAAGARDLRGTGPLQRRRRRPRYRRRLRDRRGARDLVGRAMDQKAAADRDVEFAGLMDRASGVFTPAAAGPNPARKYQTNNAGNLKVIAVADDNGKPVQGEGRLLVTVQRWNNPPIR